MNLFAVIEEICRNCYCIKFDKKVKSTH